MSNQTTIALMLVGILAATLVSMHFRKPESKQTSLRPFAMNAWLLGFSVYFTFMVIEALIGNFYAASDGYGFTLAHKRWMKQHWKKNAFGYRDREYDKKDFKDKKVIFVVGDSFAAGAGIANVKDRFSNVLKDRLGPGYVVVNIARAGWSPYHEINAINSYPVKPDLVILSYYINDIKAASSSLGHHQKLISPNKVMRYLAERLNVVDMGYWRFYKISQNYSTYAAFLRHAFEDKDIWGLHVRELLYLTNIVTKQHGAHLVVIAFPHLSDIPLTGPLTEKVCGLFSQNNIPCIDASEIYKDWKIRDRIVSSRDQHPSVKAHKEAAEVIIKYVKEVL